ncbi:MAG: nucleotidyltransferase domain-containing protein [Chloroflexi bacterium]|nr:nucleotidyltransferase domain-containing protein [Chloroflexota bacterium]
MNQRIAVSQDELAAFCHKYRVRKLSLFGSVLRADFRDDSDIDVLVEFEPDAVVDLFDIVEMEITLAEMFDRKVDVRTPQDLSRHFRQRVIDTAEILYERR